MEADLSPRRARKRSAVNGDPILSDKMAISEKELPEQCIPGMMPPTRTYFTPILELGDRSSSDEGQQEADYPVVAAKITVAVMHLK